MAEIKPIGSCPFMQLVIVLVLSIPFVAISQTNTDKVRFSTVNQFGLLNGSKGEAVSIQTINGVKKGQSFAGVGVGLDFYGLRTIPLFLDFRRDIINSKNSPFVYLNGGTNFRWMSEVESKQLQSPIYTPGFFYDLGAGIKLSGKYNRAAVFSLGYSVKQVKYKLPSYPISPTPQMQAEDFDRYNYLYRRIVVKLGFQL